MDIKYSLAIIAIVALGTFFTRALPFIVFAANKPPKAVLYIGKYLPSAVIAVLVVYCLGSEGMDIHTLAPKLIAGAAVALLHIWKRNNLLSIGLGTLLYMALVQLVFN